MNLTTKLLGFPSIACCSGRLKHSISVSWLLFLGWLLISLPTSVYSSEKYNENQVHAVFLYNVTQFISWPKTAFHNETSPINICIIGKTPIAEYLTEIIDGDQVKGRSLVVENVESINTSTACHVLFFTKISARLHSDNLKSIKRKPILLVSPSKIFLERGGMLALIRNGKRIKPIINLKSVREAKISISSKLLRLATIVNIEK